MVVIKKLTGKMSMVYVSENSFDTEKPIKRDDKMALSNKNINRKRINLFLTRRKGIFHV